MSRVRAGATVRGRPEEVQALWEDVSRWPAFVDGFGSVVRADPDWPARGELIWHSRPGGRGRVIERAGGRFEDARLEGARVVRFQPDGPDTRVTVVLEFRLKERSVVAPVRELVVVRSQLRDTLRRTLRRFAAECGMEAELRAGQVP